MPYALVLLYKNQNPCHNASSLFPLLCMTHTFLRVAHRNLPVTLFLAAVFFALPMTTHAAARFWVGGTGNWGDTAHWSATIGGAGGAAVPTASDTATFNNKSGGGTVAVRSVVNVLGLHLNSGYTGSILQGTGTVRIGTSNFLMGGTGAFVGGTAAINCGSGFTMTGGTVSGIQDTMTLSGSLNVTGGTFTSTGTIVLEGANQNINASTAGISSLTIGSSGTATLQANVTVSSTITVNAGSTLALGMYTLTATNTTIVNAGTINEGTGKISHTATNFVLANSSFAEASGFNVGDTVYLTLTESDENIDGTAADTLTVTVTSGGGDSETVTLTETGLATGIFRGSISSSIAAVSAGDGSLESPSGDDTLTATYTDAQDLLTNSDSASFNVVSSGTVASGGGGSGGGRRGPSSSPSHPKSNVNTPIVPQAPHMNTLLPLQQRTCQRVAKRFSSNASMLGRINQRLQKRFGWSCN